MNLNPELFIRDLPRMQETALSMEVYDSAPKAAKKLFGRVRTPQKIRDIAESVFTKFDNPKAWKLIGAAFRYSFVKECLRNGSRRKGIGMIEELVSEDPVISHQNKLFLELGSTYLNECLKRGVLITPQDTDGIVFDNSVIHNFVYRGDYWTLPGLAVESRLSKEKSNLLTLAYDNTSAQKVEIDGCDEVSISLNLNMGIKRTKVRGLNSAEQIQTYFGNLGLDFHYLTVNNVASASYLALRHVLKRQVDLLSCIADISEQIEYLKAQYTGFNIS